MRFTKSEAFLIFLLATIQFCHIVDFMILMPLGPQIMRLMTITPGQFSFLVACYTLSAGLSGFLASFYIDNFDRKNILTLFFIGFTLGTFACGFTTTYTSFLIARCLAGVFGGVLTSIVLSILSDNFEYERRGTAIGTVMGAFALASVFGVPFGLYISNLSHWQMPFIVLGLLSSFLVLTTFIFVPLQNKHLVVGRNRDPLQILKMIFKNRNQQLALGLIFFMVMGQFTVIPFISPSFVLNGGLPEDQLPLIYLFGGFCSMFAAPIVGKISDLTTKNGVFAVALILSIFPIYLITNLNPSPVWLMILISSSFFIVMSGRMVPAMAIITSTAPTEMRAGFLSIVSSIQQLSAAFAAWTAGQIIVEGQGTTLLNYNIVGYIAIASSLITFLFSFKVKAKFD